MMSSTQDTKLNDRIDTNTEQGGVIMLPVPIPIPVSVDVHSIFEPRIVVVTKFFSWLTACLLTTAVLISLFSITSERNDLREQISRQNDELTCRSIASVAVNIATNHRDNLMAEVLIAIAEKDDKKLATHIEKLLDSTIEVDVAIAAQKNAVETCAEG